MSLLPVNPNKVAINLLKNTNIKELPNDEKSPISKSVSIIDNAQQDTDDDSLKVLAGSSKYSLGSSNMDDASTRGSIKTTDGNKKPFGKTFKRVYKKIFKKQYTKSITQLETQSIPNNPINMNSDMSPKRNINYRGQLPNIKGNPTFTVFKISIFAAFINTTLSPSSPSLIAIKYLEELQDRFSLD
ncbi:hypothetical protein K4I79_003155 [Candida tropicalis]